MAVRRRKTYAGYQGYVYQYDFVGKRPAETSNSTEHIFDVTLQDLARRALHFSGMLCTAPYNSSP